MQGLVIVKAPMCLILIILGEHNWRNFKVIQKKRTFIAAERLVNRLYSSFLAIMHSWFLWRGIPILISFLDFIETIGM